MPVGVWMEQELGISVALRNPYGTDAETLIHFLNLSGSTKARQSQRETY